MAAASMPVEVFTAVADIADTPDSDIPRCSESTVYLHV
jgi:hypothetical protein